MIALDTQVGVERVSPSLVEMGRSFGALLIAVFAFAASEAVGYFERKVSFYATGR